MIAVETRNLSGVVLASYHYTLNSKGQRTHVEEGAGGQISRSIDYEYDAADRLIEERISDSALGNRTISYTYDSVGNRLSRADNGVVTEYSYDENDRLLTESGFSYTHDDNGNLLTKTGNGENWQLEYNALNQLTRANISTPQGASVSEYTYDHDGIRVGKTINGSDEVKYLVDVNRPYAQVIEEAWTRGGLSATTNYVYGHGLVSQNIDGVNSFYHYDGFHNTRSLTDMNGAVTDSYRYDAYGTLLNRTGITTNPYLYRSEQFDEETDSYYLRARYYQQKLGRFLSTDPLEGYIAHPLSLHRYLYANNDPVSNIDPSGEISLSEGLATVGIIGSLSAIGWNAGNFEQLQGFYEFVADTYAPDAGILGVSVFKKILDKPVIDFILPKALDIATDRLVSHIVTPYHDPFQVSGGVVGGGELMFNFGSSEMGVFLYAGGQLELQHDNAKKLKGTDISLYTGYVFNLWNCQDYTEAFMSINFPAGSFFFDPVRFWQNAPHPWGVSWPFWSNSRSKTVTGLNGTWFWRILVEDPFYVPYGKLAFDWTLIQSALTLVLAYNQQETAAIVTGFGAAATGMLVKSKQIYNEKHNFDREEGGRQIYERRSPSLRPEGWRSGPMNPLSMLKGLW